MTISPELRDVLTFSASVACGGDPERPGYRRKGWAFAAWYPPELAIYEEGVAHGYFRPVEKFEPEPYSNVARVTDEGLDLGEQLLADAKAT